jgi:hypothetical protein
LIHQAGKNSKQHAKKLVSYLRIAEVLMAPGMRAINKLKQNGWEGMRNHHCEVVGHLTHSPETGTVKKIHKWQP